MADMGLNAVAKTIAEVFSLDTKHQRIVPPYQRSYAWKEDQVEALLNDLTEAGTTDSPGELFLGTILQVQNASYHSSSPYGKWDIVDGQQRLMTISLIYAVIYYLLGKYAGSDTSDEKRADIKRKLLIYKKGRTTEDKLAIVPQLADRATYYAILGEVGILDGEGQADKRTVLYKRYKQILEYFNDEDSFPDEESIFNFIDILERSTLVVIDVKNVQHAYQLFDALNNRGKPLDPIDIIKNKLFAKLDADERKEGIGADAREREERLRNMLKVWDRMLRTLNPKKLDDTKTHLRYLKDFYNSQVVFEEGYEKVDGFVVKRTLIEGYDKVLKDMQISAQAFLNRMASVAEQYYGLIDPEPPKENRFSVEEALYCLKVISAAPVYQLLLYLATREGYCWSDFGEIFEMVKHFFVRRHIVGLPKTGKLEGIFQEILRKVKGAYSEETYKGLVQEDLSEAIPDDELFLSRLQQLRYDKDSKLVRAVLVGLELRHGNWSDLKGLRSLWDANTWQIDHIIPQSVIDKNSELNDVLGEVVHSIGNLTITEKNQEMRDKTADKLGYLKQEFWLNKAIFEEWGEVDKLLDDPERAKTLIERRTEELAEKAVETFRI